MILTMGFVLLLSNAYSQSSSCFTNIPESCSFSGSKIEQDKVKDRIRRWGQEPSNLTKSSEDNLNFGVHFESDTDGNPQGILALTFAEADICSLVSAVSSNSSIVAGIRVCYGMDTVPESPTFAGLRIFLIPVDTNGDPLYPTGENQVLGFSPSLNTISNSACLNLEVTDQPAVKGTADSAQGWHTSTELLAYMDTFETFLSACDPEGDWDVACQGYTCPLEECQTKEGYWKASYTFCIDYFDQLLYSSSDTIPAAAGIRFYMGTRSACSSEDTDGECTEWRYTEHVPAMVAVDNNGVDICLSTNGNEIQEAYIDWAQPCPSICNGGKQVCDYLNQ